MSTKPSFFDEYDVLTSTSESQSDFQKSGIQRLIQRNDSEDDDEYEYDRSTSVVSERANSEAKTASIVVFGGIFAYSFVVCLENVIVFPSLWPNLLQYCDGVKYTEQTLQSYLGYTMGAFSLGRGLSALIINSRLPTRTNMRVSATICFLLSAFGCGLYVLARSPETLVLARLLSGLGAGALTLMITALTSLSSPETRTNAISQFFVAAGKFLCAVVMTVVFVVHAIVGRCNGATVKTKNLSVVLVWVHSSCAVYSLLL